GAISGRIGYDEFDDVMCSFAPSTRVLMAGGKTKSIIKIKVGDKVQAADPKTGKHQGARTVQRVWINHDHDLLDLTVRTKSGHAATLHTTANHPFWNDATHTWVLAGELRHGDALNTPTKGHVFVSATKVMPGAADRWNLTVQRLHTYYVLAGATPVLVHNCDGEVDWVNEPTRAGAAQDYEDGAQGARSRVSTQKREVPALDYINLEGDTRQVKFDGFDEENGVMIDRKYGVATAVKTQRTVINQSMALEQNGYTGMWEVANQRAYNRATRMFARLGVTNIGVRVVAP
ncbi:polymorphic toxin-type HINT domain-containing protein, partial [Streptomyces sp. 900105755]